MKEIINHPILPHELKQEHKTGLIVLKVLKVAHEQFTWSGGEIPRIGRYGGHKWKVFGSRFGCTSRAHTQYRLLASKAG